MPPLIVVFDVNNGPLREEFLSVLMPKAMEPLYEQAQPAWGQMSPQQMVEHLLWGFDLSIGEQSAECQLPKERYERMRAFLYNNNATPKEYMNPLLASGLPCLRQADLATAKTRLRAAIERFQVQSEQINRDVPTHPLFGPMGYEEWSRVHFKHCFHHLLQFGLISAPEDPICGE
jgi:oxepin-CoA hydrolase/3-oxo-5,6-dehydrosuberyl-CoA semialdehyde dehydrogenase